MTVVALWRTIYERFDPEEPASPELRVERKDTPVAEIDRGLGLPFGDSRKKFLVYGTVGTGKSTELEKLAHMRSTDDFVILFDIGRLFEEAVGDSQALQKVEPWEVVFLCGVHIWKGAAEGTFGHGWTPALGEELMKAYAELSNQPEAARVDIGRLVKSVSVLVGGAVGGPAGAALEWVEALADSVGFEVPVGGGRSRATGRRLTDQDPKVRNLLDVVNRMILELKTTFGRAVTLVVDGLDRIVVGKTTEALFVRSRLLSKLTCSSAFAAPLALRQQGLAGRVDGFRTKTLANVPVLDHSNPSKPSSEVEFFVRLFSKRVEDLPGGSTAISEPLLRQLGFSCGGRARDFVRFVAGVAERGHHARVEEATPDMIEDVIEERRQIIEEGMNRRHIEILKSVMHDPRHTLPDGDEVIELLSRWWLLPFPNESVWYFPHPLLNRRLIG